MRTVRAILVVKADGTLRVLSGKRNPALGLDEMAVPINVSIPDGWATIDATQAITIIMPDPPTVEQSQ